MSLMFTDEKLENLAQNYLDFLLEQFPFMGTYLGIHDNDSEMPEGTLASLEHYFTKRKKFYNDVEALNDNDLSTEARITKGALLNTLSVQMFEDEVHGRWRSHPEISMILGTSIHLLLLKDFAPLPERLGLITARLKKFPLYLENIKAMITDPVGIWVEMAIEECSGVSSLIRIVQETASKADLSENQGSQLNDAAEAAIQALSRFAAWLADNKLPRSRSNFAMEPDEYEKFIELRQLGMNTEELLEFGWRMLDEAKERQRELLSRFAGGKTPDEYKLEILANHPASFEEALRQTIEATVKSREFVIQSGYATLPEGEKLLVVETPEYIRNLIPFGAYNPPGRFDKKQLGYYWMSRPINEQTLEMHHYGAIINTSVHEGYPGHHLQLVCANTNRSTARLLTNGTEYCEGWAHYCEEKVAEMGFSTEPEVMFERYNDMIWRALRIIVDVKLSRGEIGFGEAVDLLQEIAGMDRPSCVTEVKRYTFNPGYQLSYLVGKKMIKDLHDEVKSKTGKDFNLRKFHDSMLYAGTMPMKYMAETVRNAFGINKRSLVKG